jgi:hypothetical protein
MCSRSSPRLPLHKGDGRITPLMVLPSSRRCSNSGTAVVLNVRVCWHTCCIRTLTPQLIWARLKLFLVSLMCLPQAVE